MTRSIRKGQKRLRKKAKPHDPHAQSPGYWRREQSRREACGCDRDEAREGGFKFPD